MTTEVTVSREVMKTVLAEFDKAVDEEGFIVEQDTGDPVLTPRGEEVTLDDLAGIAQGSEIFIEDNFVSLLEYVESKR